MELQLHEVNTFESAETNNFRRINKTKNMKKDYTKRNEKIFKLRESGATFSEIASVFNITPSRVQQLYKQVKLMKENYDTLPPFQKLISNRVQNGLVYSFKDQNIFENPKKIWELGPYKMFRKPFIGKVSLNEIASALNKLGYIKPGDEWSEYYKDDLSVLYN